MLINTSSKKVKGAFFPCKGAGKKCGGDICIKWSGKETNRGDGQQNSLGLKIHTPPVSQELL